MTVRRSRKSKEAQDGSVLSPSEEWSLHSILDEGEEVTLVSGVDPHRFAEIRSLGLINEQIDWKQRFFVPSDEEIGVVVLSQLLARYPVMGRDVLADEEPAEIETAELMPAQIVNLDEWFVPVATFEPTAESDPSAAEQALAIEKAETTLTLPAFYFARSQPAGEVEEIQLALDFG